MSEQAIEQVRISDLNGTGRTGFVCDAADDLELHDVRIDATEGPSFAFTHSRRLQLDNLGVTRAPANGAPVVSLSNVSDVWLQNSRAVEGTNAFAHVDGERTAGVILSGNELAAAKQPFVITSAVPTGAVSSR